MYCALLKGLPKGDMFVGFKKSQHRDISIWIANKFNYELVIVPYDTTTGEIKSFQTPQEFREFIRPKENSNG